MPEPIRRHRLRIFFGYVCGAAAAMAVLLLQPAGRPLFNSIWAEDGKIFLSQGLGGHWYSPIFRSYQGYLHIVPRMFGIATRLIPLSDTAVFFTLGSAAVRVAVALFVFRASAGHFRASWPRVALAAFVIVVPSGETLDNVANLHWYLVYAAVWAVLWRPDTRWENGLAALVVGLATGSDPLALVVLPVVLVRCLTLRRLRDHAVTVACAIAGIAQVAVLLSASRVEARPPAWPEIARAFDARILLGLVASMHGASNLVLSPYRLAAMIGALVLLGLAVLPGLRADWPTRLTVLYLLGASAVIFTLGWRHTLGYIEFPSRGLGANSRYTVTPMLLAMAAVLVSFSAVRGVRRRLALVSTYGAGVLIAATVGIALNPTAIGGVTWHRRLAVARWQCRSGRRTDVIVLVDPAPRFSAQLPCARLVGTPRR